MFSELCTKLCLSPISRYQKGYREKKLVEKGTRRNTICFDAAFLNENCLIGIKKEITTENMGFYKDMCSPSRVYCICSICYAGSLQRKTKCKGECLKLSINQCDECTFVEIAFRQHLPPPILSLVHFDHIPVDMDAIGITKDKTSQADKVITMISTLVNLPSHHIKSSVVSVDIVDSSDGNKGEKDISINFSTKEITHKLMGTMEITLRGTSDNYGIARIGENFISVFISIKPSPANSPEKVCCKVTKQLMEPRTI